VKTLLFTLTLFTSIAANAECLPQDKVDTILSRFKIRTDQTLDVCDPTNHSTQIVNALIYISELEFDGPAANPPYNQEIIGYDWFNRLVNLAPRILWGPSLSGGAKTCEKAGAFAREGLRGRMYFCPSTVKTDEVTDWNVIEVVKVLLHESRHLEDDGYDHVDCKRGPRACDLNVAYKGAYAVGMEALAKIGKTATNVHPATAQLALRLAFVEALDSFKVPAAKPILDQNVVLLQDREGRRRWLLNYRYHAEAFSYLEPGRIFVEDVADSIFVPTDVTHPAHNIGTFETSSQEDDVTSGIDHQAAVESAGLKDVYFPNVPGVKVSIYGDSIRFFKRDVFRGDVQAELKLPSGHPMNLRPFNAGDEPESSRVYILSDEDRLFALDWSDKPQLTEVQNAYPGFISVARVEISEPQEDWQSRQAANEERIRKLKPKAYDAALEKFKKNDPRPPLQYKVYALNKDGQLLHETPLGFVTVKEFLDRRFQSMSNGFTASGSVAIPDDM
jgi:hypothetical protein